MSALYLMPISVMIEDKEHLQYYLKASVIMDFLWLSLVAYVESVILKWNSVAAILQKANLMCSKCEDMRNSNLTQR